MGSQLDVMMFEICRLASASPLRACKWMLERSSCGCHYVRDLRVKSCCFRYLSLPLCRVTMHTRDSRRSATAGIPTCWYRKASKWHESSRRRHQTWWMRD